MNTTTESGLTFNGKREGVSFDVEAFAKLPNGRRLYVVSVKPGFDATADKTPFRVCWSDTNKLINSVSRWHFLTSAYKEFAGYVAEWADQ